MVTAPASGKALVPRKLPVVADRKFLPADLEILETPPSPVRLALILVICRPRRRRRRLGLLRSHRHRRCGARQDRAERNGLRLIQPLEPGKVAAILVANGQHVKAGQILIELDAGDAKAEEAEAQDAYDSYRAEAKRRRVAIAAAQVRQLAARRRSPGRTMCRPGSGRARSRCWPATSASSPMRSPTTTRRSDRRRSNATGSPTR